MGSAKEKAPRELQLLEGRDGGQTSDAGKAESIIPQEKSGRKGLALPKGLLAVYDALGIQVRPMNGPGFSACTLHTIHGVYIPQGVCGDGRPRIWINDSDPGPEQLATAYHELWHHLSHQIGPCKRISKRREEQLARRFSKMMME